MPQFPKFEQKLRSNVVDRALQQGQKPGYAVVVGFDPVMNTCDIITASPGSDELGEVLTNIPCPTQSGVQGAAPRPGVMAWVAYRDGTTGDPFITHFFDPSFDKNQYTKQYNARNDTPRFLVQM